MLLLLASAAHAESTVVPLTALLPRQEVPEEAAPIQAAVRKLTVSVVPGEESRLTLTYAIQAFADGMAVAALGAGPLVVEEARLDGRPLAVPPEQDGHRRLVAPLTRGTHTVVLSGVMPTPQSRIDLPLPDAPVEVVVDGAGLEVAVEGGAALSPGRLILPPSPALALTWKPEGPPAPRPDRLEAVAAVGLTLSTDGVEGAGVVSFDAVRGAVERVRIAVSGADWAEASGRVVAASRLSAGWLEVDLIAPQTGRFTVDVALRGPGGEELTAAPLLLPEADSREGWVSLYQGEEGHLSRQLSDLDVVSPAAVPDWGRDLAGGQLLSSLHYDTGQPALSWRQSEWEALQTPGTVIDSARYEVAVAEHGRALTRSRFQVRNDRGAWLWMTVPDGGTVLVVRVAGHVVEPITDGERLGIPLEKSVETLTGLVSFPVEVTTLAPAPTFSRRGRVTLSVPAISAPIADATWTLHLPPGTIPRRTEGNVQPAGDGPDAELLLGRAHSVSSTSVVVSSDAEEVSQDLWNQAYDAYKDNRFDDASALLDQSLIHNPGNSAASALQDNVYVLTGEAEVSEEEVEQVERVKAMARAKSKDDAQRQAELVQSADEQLRAGNVDEAIALYSSAIEVSDQLARLESDEAYVQKAVSEDLRGRLRSAEETSSRNRRLEARESEEESAVYERIQQIEAQQASEEQRLYEMERSVVHREEREKRYQEQFEVLKQRTAQLAHDLEVYGGCPVMIEMGGTEMMEMVLEQAWMVLDAEAIDMAGDILMFIDDLQPQIDQLKPDCELAEITAQVEALKEEVFQSAATLTLQREMILVDEEPVPVEEELDSGAFSFGDDDIDGDLVSPDGAVHWPFGGEQWADDPPPPPASPPPGDFKRAAPALTQGLRDLLPAGRADPDIAQAVPGVAGGAPAWQEDTPVQTVSAAQAPVGVTASRWIVLVPASGPTLAFSRQLVPAGEALSVEVPYRRPSSGRQGG